MPEEDQATDIGNMQKTFGKDRVCGSGDIFVDSQTHRQIDILITTLHIRLHGRSKYYTILLFSVDAYKTDNSVLQRQH